MDAQIRTRLKLQTRIRLKHQWLCQKGESIFCHWVCKLNSKPNENPKNGAHFSIYCILIPKRYSFVIWWQWWWWYKILLLLKLLFYSVCAVVVLVNILVVLTCDHHLRHTYSVSKLLLHWLCIAHFAPGVLQSYRGPNPEVDGVWCGSSQASQHNRSRAVSTPWPRLRE